MKTYDVIIVGGSHAGLSAALCLGRSLRQTLVIDSGNPCNQSSPQVHNLLIQDGEIPHSILEKSKRQVLGYPTVAFWEDVVISAEKGDGFFAVGTQTGKTFRSQKLLFATGLTDIMPDIPGFSECWGQSVLHCPYCHGYEAKGTKTGILGNGGLAYEMAKSVRQWTNDLVIFTNGRPVFSESEIEKFKLKNIAIIDSEIKSIEQTDGWVENLVFKDGKRHEIHTLYAHPHTKQQCNLMAFFGCKTNSHGCVETDVFQRTNIPGIYAAGDCSSVGRAVSVAIAAGTVAGMFINKEMIEEAF
ncbi:NAD(P)/FAD-dependent oxidoreductase [Flavobacterium sp.]|uniref:NAD(P)/FAD-dependent oxidoreductase n=1 Tax=Flavobacterium sp. TaxID=239 RepID=UPI0039E534FE